MNQIKLGESGERLNVDGSTNRPETVQTLAREEVDAYFMAMQ